MHWGELIASLLGYIWPPPTRRSPGDTSSRLSDWADWGLFTFSVLVVLFIGFVFLLR
jgi:hypothetical protein